MRVARRALRYLRYTADAKLVFQAQEELLHWLDTLIQISQETEAIGSHKAGAFSKHTEVQSPGTLVVGSTTEAEYSVCSEAAREVQWLTQLHTLQSHLVWRMAN